MLGMSEEEAGPFVEAYDRAFPEVAMLMRKAMDSARSRGWVKTLTGRRARFLDRQFLHSALNRVIQGQAADINKKKLVEVYKERKRIGFVMRATVHDEMVGDVPDVQAAKMIDDILAEQTTPLNIPILWDGKTGRNWREVK
jgi:DNA polymerase-1